MKYENKNSSVKIFGIVLLELDKSVKIQDAMQREIYLPKSQIRKREKLKDSIREAFYIPEWLAEKYGFI